MFNNDDPDVKRPYVYIASLILTLLWVLIILCGPLLYKLPPEYLFAADFYYYLFHYSCHQIPSRCYWIFDYQLPVCVRCFGIYFGAFLGLVIYPLIRSIKSTNLPNKYWLALCFGPIALDGISSLLHLYASPHWLRLLTGIICGAVAMYYIVPGLNELAKTFLGED